MKYLLALIILAAIIAFGGFVWMISLGALSHIFDVPRLAISFWQSVLVSIIFGLLFSAGSRN